MASACALAMFSGKIVFIFGIAERLRTLRYPIFTGGFTQKAPGSGVLLGAGCNYCAAVLVSSKLMAT